jgi:hypothetical protein
VLFKLERYDEIIKTLEYAEEFDPNGAYGLIASKCIKINLI